MATRLILTEIEQLQLKTLFQKYTLNGQQPLSKYRVYDLFNESIISFDYKELRLNLEEVSIDGDETLELIELVILADRLK